MQLVPVIGFIYGMALQTPYKHCSGKTPHKKKIYVC